MAVITIAAAGAFRRFLGQSQDAKPAGVMPGSEFWEVDTGIIWRYDGANWLVDTAGPLFVAVTKLNDVITSHRQELRAVLRELREIRIIQATVAGLPAPAPIADQDDPTIAP